MRFVSIGWIINNNKKNKHLDINKGLIKFVKKNIMCRVKVLHTTQASLTAIEQRKNTKKLCRCVKYNSLWIVLGDMLIRKILHGTLLFPN